MQYISYTIGRVVEKAAAGPTALLTSSSKVLNTRGCPGGNSLGRGQRQFWSSAWWLHLFS